MRWGYESWRASSDAWATEAPGVGDCTAMNRSETLVQNSESASRSTRPSQRSEGPAVEWREPDRAQDRCSGLPLAAQHLNIHRIPGFVERGNFFSRHQLEFAT